jgi:hypothetical protein
MVPLDTTIDLLDRALATLIDESAADVSREEIADIAAAVGRLVAAIDTLIRQAEAADAPFADFLAEHPELARRSPDSGPVAGGVVPCVAPLTSSPRATTQLKAD